MAAYKKPVLTLFISIVLFAGFAFLAETGLLNYIHTYFFNPSTVGSFVKENQKDAEVVQIYINDLQNRFAATLNEPAIRSSFLYNQSAADIFERSRIYGILLETVGGLQAVQFIDSNGIRIHYSTSARDIVSQNRESTAYRNYNEDSRALPYDSVSIPAYENSKFTMDDASDRIIFSYPFYDSMDVYRGTALFTLSVRSLAEKLIAEGRLKPTDEVSVIRIPPGVVFGSPASSRIDINSKISAIWSGSFSEYITLDAEESGTKLALISTKTDQNLFFGRLVNDSLFFISLQMKLLLYFSIFFTFYLTIFALVNLRPNPVLLVQNRIKTLRMNLIEQLYLNKNGQDRVNWIVELEQRRDEIRFELKHRLRMSRNVEKKVDEIIDKTWDELLVVMKSGSGYAMREMPPVQTGTYGATSSTADEADHIEEVEALEEIDEIEEISEIEKISEIEEITEDDEIEETLDEINEIEEIDTLIEDYEPPPVHGSASGGAASGGSASGGAALGGLLKLASKIVKAGGVLKTEAFNDIEEIKVVKATLLEGPELSYAQSKPARRGLLALANAILASARRRGLLARASKKREATPPARGLLALAREIEFSQNIKPYEDTRGLDAELDIVSPFQSMFSAL